MRANRGTLRCLTERWFHGRLSSLSNEEDIRLCFVDWSPKLFAFFGHCLRRGRPRIPPDPPSPYRSRPLLFRFHVLAPKEPLPAPQPSRSFFELHLYPTA